MSQSRVDIYNLALGCIRVGERVSAVDDEIAREYMLPQFYAMTMSGIMSRHDWSFAIVNRKLGLVDGNRWDHDTEGDIRKHAGKVHEVAPAALYGWRWIYPADCQKLIEVGIVHPVREKGCSDITNIFDFAQRLP